PHCVSVNPTDVSVWVADYGNDRVIKLESSISDGYTIGTHTGSHTVFNGFSKPISVSVNSADGSVWVADNYNNEVVKLDAAGAELARKSGFNKPYSVSVNSTDGTVWVADDGNDEIVKLASDGTELVRLGGFDQPRAVAVADTGAENSYTSPAPGDTSHTYSVPGIYQAALTIKDNEGHIDRKTVQIRVYGTPTVAAQSDISTGDAPLEVFFSGAAADLDGHIVEYSWDFDGDGLYDVSSQNTANARHVYGTAGVYNAVLRAKDDDGYTSTSTAVVITVGQSPPVATAYAGPVMGNAPLDVSFSGSGTDSDGTIAAYEWDFDTDGTYDDNSSTSAETTHIYDTAGSYIATLRITDNDGNTATDTIDIEVNPAGTPFAMLHAEPLSGTNPLEVRFWGFGIDQDGSITSYEWDFDNDGTFGSASGSPPTAFGDTMEFGESYWTADAPWARIYTDYHSKTYCWADSPEGDTDASLITATIDLSGSVAPRLVFRHHYALASGDYARVYVSGDDGLGWTELGYFTDSTLSRWTPVVYDISAHAGKSTVKIKFRIYSNSSITADGWYIDDIWVGDRFTHTYPDKGDYTAVLRVTDNESNQTAASADIAVIAHQNASFVWVADTTHHEVAKLSHDGTELARISGFSQPYAVDVVPDTGDVWVADKANDRVVMLSVDTPDGYHTGVTRITYDSAGDNNTGLLFG
ncbi:PKD domain-containing protein, partial [Thermodesulfobacteriota bacterium]